MIGIRVDTSGLRLEELQQRLSNLKPAMDAIGAAILTEVDLGFKEQRDPWGGAWAPLSPITTLPMRRKGKGRGGNKILRNNGDLANSFSHQATAKSVTVGTMDIRSGTHQFGAKKGAYGATRRGGPIPWGDIPARPMLPIRGSQVDLPEATRLEIEDAILIHIQKGG